MGNPRGYRRRRGDAVRLSSSYALGSKPQDEARVKAVVTEFAAGASLQTYLFSSGTLMQRY